VKQETILNLGFNALDAARFKISPNFYILMYLISHNRNLAS